MTSKTSFYRILSLLLGTWYPYFSDDLRESLKDVTSYLNQAYKNEYIYPKKRDVFKIYNKIKLKDVRVVVLGGYPYDDGRATGIAFANPYSSVNPGYCSTELINIHRCIERYSKGREFPYVDFDTKLKHWLAQGVMPLHLALSSKKNDRKAHKDLWKDMIVETLQALSNHNNGVIYLLLGEDAKEYKKYINKSTSIILEATYPTYENYVVYWDSSCFNKINSILKENNNEIIIW